jgi:hypothetical protein
MWLVLERGLLKAQVGSQGNVCDISNDANSFCLGMMVTLGSDDLI